MKNLTPSLLLALLALTGCGAAAEGFDATDDAAWDSPAGESADDVAATPADAADAPELATARQALISGGAGGLSAKPWCAARKNCYDQCGRDYPTGGGPLSTCKKLCDTTTASKCRPGAVGGIVLF